MSRLLRKRSVLIGGHVHVFVCIQNHKITSICTKRNPHHKGNYKYTYRQTYSTNVIHRHWCIQCWLKRIVLTYLVLSARCPRRACWVWCFAHAPCVKRSVHVPVVNTWCAKSIFKNVLSQNVISETKTIHIVGTLGCVFIDNGTHESGVTKCTTGEAWSAFSWHHSSVFHCQWTHNQVFLLLSYMLI